MAGEVRVVAVRGEIDLAVTHVLGRTLLLEGERVPSRTVIDLSGVSFMDSSGINLLSATHQTMSDAGGWLRIAGAQAPVVRVLQLVGLDTIIACHPTVEEALGH